MNVITVCKHFNTISFSLQILALRFSTLLPNVSMKLNLHVENTNMLIKRACK